MSLDTQLPQRLRAAVDDTPVPPGLAGAVLAGGRRRRRRRAAAGVALACSVGMVAATAAQVPMPWSSGPGGEAGVAGRPGGERSTVATPAVIGWARGLDAGPAPALPFFGAGGLWADGRMHDAPDPVTYDQPPRTVDGGWLVATGQGAEPTRLAVMAPDMSLRELPLAGSAEQPLDTSTAVVSPDGTRVAVRDVVVDLTTMQATQVPHAPTSATRDGYGVAVRMVGWTEAGLVYEAAPFTDGLGTAWLLADDGTAEEVPLPQGAHLADSGPADVAVAFADSADGSETCVRTYVLDAPTWRLDTQGCLGRPLREALAVSPDGRWLLTDDLPEVWDLQEGEWRTLDVPREVGREQMDTAMSTLTWEDPDTVLMVAADRWGGSSWRIGDSYEQAVQVVRCSVASGECERAGDEQVSRVYSSQWGDSAVRFAP